MVYSVDISWPNVIRYCIKLGTPCLIWCLVWVLERKGNVEYRNYTVMSQSEKMTHVVHYFNLSTYIIQRYCTYYFFLPATDNIPCNDYSQKSICSKNRVTIFALYLLTPFALVLVLSKDLSIRYGVLYRIIIQFSLISPYVRHLILIQCISYNLTPAPLTTRFSMHKFYVNIC